MEGSQWFRLGVIVALFVGSFYVLLPTIFQVDPGTLQEQIDNVSDGAPKGASEIEAYLYRLDVLDGEPEALAAAVQARLEARKISVDAVVVEDGQVVIRRKLTVTDGALDDALGPAPVVSLHPLTLPVPPEASGDAAAIAALDVVKGLGGLSPSAPKTGLELAKATTSTVTLTEAPTSDPGPLLLVVDGTVRGVVVLNAPAEDAADDASLPVGGRWASLGSYTDLPSDLALEALPGRFRHAGAVVEAATEDELAVEEEEEQLLPEWLINLMPDTRMPLGLDLQGGIDLTVQVELDEALLSQANRDITYLEDRATEKGLTISKVRRNRFEPMIEVVSPDGADAIQGFFGESMADQYEYYDDLSEDGATWHRFMMTSTRADEIQKQAVTQVLDVLRRRVAETKVRDPVVVQKGGGRISVQLPGFSDTKTAVAAIGKTAVLEFRRVDPKFRRDETRRLIDAARDALPPDVFKQDNLVNNWLHEQGLLAEDHLIQFEYEVRRDEETGEETRDRVRAYANFSRVVLSGQHINSADVQFDSRTQQPAVGLEFKPDGATIFCDFTSEHVDEQFAIILDGEVQSAPNINESICGGRAQITMNRSVNAQDEAKALAVVLRTGSLNAPVSIGSVRQIGPSLGRDAIQAGSISTILGGLVVLLFMAVWYRGPGMIANVALVLNIMLMLAGLSLFGWTLTLPGIAGIALTIGMSVDANIIIYERIREELKMGQHARKAVETGFKKAAVAVIDANITTAIAGVVLFSYGNVTLQGFAVTLLMGIGTTLLTALFVTRSLLEIVTRRTTARLRI